MKLSYLAMNKNYLFWYWEVFMDLKKRKEYLILTIVSFGMGFVIFGGLIVANKELLGITLHIFVALLIYGLGGGLLIGGLISGIFLFSNFIKNQKLFFKVVMCVLFPITFMIVCLVGILSFIPYEIYNLFVIKNIK